MTIGNRIKRKHAELGISGTDLAKKINVSKQTLYKYENDIITNIPSDKIQALSEIFGCSAAYLMGWDEQSDDYVPTYNRDHIKLIHMFSKLTPEQQQIIFNTMSAFLSSR